MNQESNNTTIWFSTNKLFINVNKTHLMVFKTKKKKSLNKRTIKLVEIEA